jgi:hypothetical protein
VAGYKEEMGGEQRRIKRVCGESKAHNRTEAKPIIIAEKNVR